jgi:hypothetical protein
MTHLDFNWPDAAGEVVRVARGRLAVAGESLRRLPFEERLQRVANVIDAWSGVDSPWRRELSGQLAAGSALDSRTLDEGLESALRAWRQDRFVACARREIAAATQAGGLVLAPFACTSVLAGGSIPMPTLLSGLLPLVLGSPVLLRETSQDPVTGCLLARSIADRDEALARCLEVVRFPAEDASAMEVFLQSPCVVATGSDQTLSAIRSQLAPGQRFVAYGHRFSIGVLGPQAAQDRANLDRTAAGLALDLARWDQTGCLSPVVVYLVGLTAAERVRIAKRIADSLEGLSLSRPRGEISTSTLAAHAAEGAEARMRAAVDEDASIFEGADFTVVLEADARPRPAPLARFLRLLPVASLAELDRALAPFSAHLSNAAVAGFESDDLAALHEQLTQTGVNRIAKPGSLQTPPIDWPHDGMPLFLPMARFAQRDPS